jgi:hypothetical protein
LFYSPVNFFLLLVDKAYFSSFFPWSGQNLALQLFMVIIWILWVCFWDIIQMQLPVLWISFLNCWHLSQSQFRYLVIFFAAVNAMH